MRLVCDFGERHKNNFLRQIFGTQEIGYDSSVCGPFFPFCKSRSFVTVYHSPDDPDIKIKWKIDIQKKKMQDGSHGVF